MSPTPQQTESVVFDTSIASVPTGTLQPQDFTGLPAQQTATATPSPSSSSNAQAASPMDSQQHGSGKGVGVAVGIAIAIVFLVMLSTIMLFCSRKRKQTKLAQQAARLIRRSQIEDAPPPYPPSKHGYHNSMYKGDLPAVPNRPQGMVVNERPPIRSDTTPSMPMTHVTEGSGSWATLPTMPTQPSLPKAYVPGKLAPTPIMSSRFSS
jgi:hypothetical protein